MTATYVGAPSCVRRSWTQHANMPGGPSGDHWTSAVLGTDIYMLGYSTNPYGFLRYSTLTGIWSILPHPPPWLNQSGTTSEVPITAYGGEIWAWGMTTGVFGDPYNLVYSFNPNTVTWTQRPSLPQGRYAPLAATGDGKTVVYFGREPFSSLNVTGLVQVYDHLTNTWGSSFTPSNWVGFSDAVGVSLNGKFYAIGPNNTITAPILAYELDLAAQLLVPIPSIPFPGGGRIGRTCAGGGRLWQFGGVTSGGLFGALTNAVYSWAPGETTWIRHTGMPKKFFRHMAQVVGSNLWIAGGLYDSSGQSFATNETYCLRPPRAASGILVSSVDDTRVRFNDTHNPSLIVR